MKLEKNYKIAKEKKISEGLKKFLGNFSLNLRKSLEKLWNFIINDTNI